MNAVTQAAKDLLAKAKGMFNSPLVITPAAPIVPEAAAIVPTAYKLKDGSEIGITMAGTAPGVGDMVTVGGVAAPAGEYTLEDDSVISVDATGLITLIVSPTPITQPDFTESPAPKAPTLEERAKKLEEKISAIETQISGFSIPTDTVTSAQLAEAEAKIAKQDEVIKTMFELCEKLVGEPMTEPVTLNGARKEKFEKRKQKDDQLERIATAMKEIKVLN